jgi:hypothetical protein
VIEYIMLKTKRVPLTIERLREVLAYDPATGHFIWRRDNTRVKAGAIAGGIDSWGYRQIKIDGRMYLAHRLAWFFARGEWPEFIIDHRNGEKLDNRIDNLRPATDAESARNAPLKSSNRTGLKGVCWNKEQEAFKASICVNKKHLHLGYFETAEAAHQAYCAAAANLHGDFARTQ